MKKKLLSMILAGALAVAALTGCEDGQSANASGNGSNMYRVLYSSEVSSLNYLTTATTNEYIQGIEKSGAQAANFAGKISSEKFTNAEKSDTLNPYGNPWSALTAGADADLTLYSLMLIGTIAYRLWSKWEQAAKEQNASRGTEPLRPQANLGRK